MSNVECNLSPALKPRHVTMLSIAGVIGAGLFVGSGHAIAAAGPAVGVVILQRLRERARGLRPARTRGTSASLPAAPRTPD